MTKNQEFSQQTSFIEQKLGYTFTNKRLLLQAFIHSSYLNESQIPNLSSYERLEFLGDAVLNLFISEFLFNYFPDENEGVLSKIKAYLICQKTCSDLMDELNLIDYLLVARGQQELAGKSRITLSSDLFESVLGAIFLDGGWTAAHTFLSDHFLDRYLAIAKSPPENPKAELQEFVSKKGEEPPIYKLVETSGPPHKRTFTIAVYVNDLQLGQASGSSKREAEQLAATLALKKLR